MAIATEQLAVVTSAVVAAAAALSPVLSRMLERGMLVDAKAAEWRALWWTRRCGLYERIVACATVATQTVWDADGGIEETRAAGARVRQMINSGVRAETNAFASPDVAHDFETFVRSLRVAHGEQPAEIEDRVAKAYTRLCDRIRREMRQGPREARV